MKRKLHFIGSSEILNSTEGNFERIGERSYNQRKIDGVLQA
jgi:hypothetical protein